MEGIDNKNNVDDYDYDWEKDSVYGQDDHYDYKIEKDTMRIDSINLDEFIQKELIETEIDSLNN